MHSVRGSVVLPKPASQSLLLQLREEEKKELNQGRKGERSDTRGGTQNTAPTPTLDKLDLTCATFMELGY